MKMLRPLLPLLAFTLFGMLSLKAQDIGATAINGVNDGDTLYLGSRVTFGWEMEAKGNGFPQGTGFGIRIALQGQTADPYGQGFSFNQDLSAGQSITNGQMGLPDITLQLLPDNFSKGPANLCVYTQSPDDVDNSNDTTCADVYLKKPAWDIGITAINNPQPDADIYPDSTTTFNITIQNFSNSEIPSGTQFPFGVRFKNSTVAMSSWLGINQALAANSSVNVNLNITLPSDIPMGDQSLCMRTLWSEAEYGVDPNAGNDESCGSFNVTDGQDGGSSGIAQSKVIKNLKLYPNPVKKQGYLQYHLKTAGKVQISLHDLNGKKVRTLVNEDQTKGTQKVTFNAATLQPGPYILRLQMKKHVLTKQLVVSSPAR